ncbi:hypothetical protein [Hathewaya proteolytica]|nr:hypothetical protein [Hathewaya proteolytica]
MGTILRQGYSNKKIGISTFILVAIHDITQLYLNITYSQNSQNVLRNYHNSFIGNLMDIYINVYWLIIINILIAIIMNLFIYYYIDSVGKSFWSCSFKVCINSALLCSLTDKIIFKGSIDFLLLMDVYMVDIKDIYMIISVVLLLCEIILNDREVVVTTK